MSSLVLGLVPNQERALAEMVRVARPGGTVIVGAQGPEYFWEGMDATFRTIDMRSVLAYRAEYWPLTEAKMRTLFTKTGLDGIRVERVFWKNRFANGRETFDCFSAISSAFWYERIRPEQREAQARRSREYFERKGLVELTEDLVIAWGKKG